VARNIRPQAGHYSAAPRKQQEGELGLKERWYPIQVKQKTRPAARTLTPLKP
jgi:hypothetical protein